MSVLRGLPDAPRNLLIAITRCPVVDLCQSGSAHSCSAIVRSQAGQDAGKFQVPEPWSGHIATAPILFVSSNPSIDPKEAYPTATWSNHERDDFFANRFEATPEPWVDSRMRPRLAPTDPATWRPKGTRFWWAARARATELLTRSAVAGDDFALTEVVHCKSSGEVGVDDAQEECVRRWLKPVVEASGSRVVVLLGAHAKAAFSGLYPIVAGMAYSGPLMLEGRERLVLQLPHPNARERRANCAPLSAPQLASAREFLRARQ
jgi:hypothetical protein